MANHIVTDASASFIALANEALGARQPTDMRVMRERIVHLEAVLRTTRTHLKSELDAIIEENSDAHGVLDEEAEAGAAQYGALLQLVNAALDTTEH